MAAARAESADYEIESADRQGTRNDSRAWRDERPDEDHERGDRFLGVGSQDEATDHAGRHPLRLWRPRAVRQFALHRDVRDACGPGRAEWERKDDASAIVAR